MYDVCVSHTVCGWMDVSVCECWYTKYLYLFAASIYIHINCCIISVSGTHCLARMYVSHTLPDEPCVSP